MSTVSHDRFWTPDKLNILVETLKKLAKKDKTGWYLGPEGLGTSVIRANYNEFSSIGDLYGGFAVLVYLGILEKGRRSRKLSDYKRRFYPDKLGRKITWTDVENYLNDKKLRR